MAISIVDANETSVKEEKRLVRVYKPMPLIPREEAMRMRRATRNAADSLAPWALQELAQLASETEDGALKHKILMDLLKMSISNKSNEETDPEGAVVDGKATVKILEELEKATESSGGDTD